MASWREKLAAEAGMTLKQYLKTDAYKKAKKDREKKEKSEKESKNSYKDILDAVLKNTPAQQKVLPDFESTYDGTKLEAEDFEQAEALYTPYFEQQIANELEDLNAWSEAENISYDRSLRRARFSMAAGGGAIGSERDTQEGEMKEDKDRNVQNRVRSSERMVGTEKIQNAGFQSSGQNQEGALVGKMKESIQEGQLWYKNQRAQRYYGNAETYYSQPSAYSLDGGKL